MVGPPGAVSCCEIAQDTDRIPYVKKYGWATRHGRLRRHLKKAERIWCDKLHGLAVHGGFEQRCRQGRGRVARVGTRREGSTAASGASKTTRGRCRPGDRMRSAPFSAATICYVPDPLVVQSGPFARSQHSVLRGSDSCAVCVDAVKPRRN